MRHIGKIENVITIHGVPKHGARQFKISQYVSGWKPSSGKATLQNVTKFAKFCLWTATLTWYNNMWYSYGRSARSRQEIENVQSLFCSKSQTRNSQYYAFLVNAMSKWSKVALPEPGLSTVAILGGGWLQSPASYGLPWLHKYTLGCVVTFVFPRFINYVHITYLKGCRCHD